MGGYAGLGIIVCRIMMGLGRMTEGILTRLADKGGREVLVNASAVHGRKQ